MMLLLLAVWVLGGLVLALLVGGAVRVADQRYGLTATVEKVEAPTLV